MRIIQIIPSLNQPGGAERFTIDLSIALQEQGHQILIISLYKKVYSFFQEEIQNFGLNVIYLNKKKGLDINTARKLRTLVLQFNPDVVHTHVRTHLTMKLSRLWCKNKLIDFYHTIHSVPEKECEKPILYRIMRPLYKKRIVSPIAISDNLATQTKQYYGLNYMPNVVYNGIFTNKFTNGNEMYNRTFNFISVARFHLLKNQIMIAKATIELHKSGHRVSTVFVGNGSEYENVKQYVSDNNGNDYISFVGQIKNVNDYLQNSQCLVIPSFYEGNPISILEAMASGLAVIATTIGGPKEIITEGENGFLVDPTDLNGLTNAMKRILINHEELQSISNNNIIKVKKYDMVYVANEYSKLYLEGHINK